MAEYKRPGVFVEEIPKLPPSIASVETAIPAFIGYTEKADENGTGDLLLKPKRISSMLDYEFYFGGPDPEATIHVSIKEDKVKEKVDIKAKVEKDAPPRYLMYYCMQMFFINGGGPCYIVSVGDYSKGIPDEGDLTGGLGMIKTIDEVTLLHFPDAVNLSTLNNYKAVYEAAMAQCKELQDRFTVFDVYMGKDPNLRNWLDIINNLRNTIAGTTDDLKYSAAYFPYIYTNINYSYKKKGSFEDNDALVTIDDFGDIKTLDKLKNENNAYYYMAKSAINDIEMLLPATPAILGIYAGTDNSRGVWKAPANVNIGYATRPQILITNKEQEGLNVDAKAGKSINVIRSFPGRGPAYVWGARTLAGNDNEWRYIPVRRYFNMVEESVKNATEQFVFEPNDLNTWTRVKSMIINYLTQQWKAGALQGTTAQEAFFVHVGLDETMNYQDVLEGRMIVEIGLAVVRPAEFIILRFMHKLLSES